MGFGCRTIGSMLGYSHAMIYLYAVDFDLRPAGGQERAEAIINLLPDSLRSAISKIRMRSKIAHQRKIAPERVRIHLLIDDPD